MFDPRRSDCSAAQAPSSKLQWPGIFLLCVYAFVLPSLNGCGTGSDCSCAQKRVVEPSHSDCGAGCSRFVGRFLACIHGIDPGPDRDVPNTLQQLQSNQSNLHTLASMDVRIVNTSKELETCLLADNGWTGIILDNNGHYWIVFSTKAAVHPFLLIHGRRDAHQVDDLSDIGKATKAIWLVQSPLGSVSRKLKFTSSTVRVSPFFAPVISTNEETVARTVLHIENHGPDDLIIASPKTSCACTTVAFDNKTVTLPAGQHLDIPVTVSHGENSWRQAVYIPLRSGSDTESRVIDFELVGVGRPRRITVVPSHLDFGHVTPESRKNASRWFEVRHTAYSKAGVTRVDAPDWLEVTPVSSSNGNVARYSVRFRRDAIVRAGENRGSVLVHTTDPHQPVLELGAQMRFIAPVVIEPPALFTRDATLNVPVGHELRLRASDHGRLDVERVDFPPEWSCEQSRVSESEILLKITGRYDKSGIQSRRLVVHCKAAYGSFESIIECRAVVRNVTIN